jgi:opacity protein-like surface antigen
MGLPRIALSSLGILIALAAAGEARAQQRPGIPTAQVWYVGVGAGVSWYDGQDPDFNIPTLATQGMSDTTFGAKIYGGYRLTPYFGLEGSYADLGKASGGSSYKVSSINVAGVGRIPFGTGFFLQGKVGAAFTRAEGFGNHYYRTNLLLGGGVGYDLTDGATLLAEYEYYGKAGSKTAFDPTTGAVTGTGRADAHFWTVGAMLRF